MKWLVPVLAAALGLAAILMPPPETPQPNAAPGTVVAPLAICPTEEGGTRSSDLSIVSTVAGAGRLTIFSGGGSAGTGEYETGASGSATIPVGDVAAVGKASGLVEFPASDSAAASITTGGGIISADVCSRIPDRQVIVGAGSTIEDRIFQIQLMNPYSAEAVADITAFSESGRESSEALRSIIVPARSSVVLDVSSILPGRENLNLVAEVTRGSLVTSASMEFGGDQAIWRGVAPEEIWYLPVPVYGGARQAVISASTPGEVAYQVDVFGPGGFEEAAIEGTVSGGGQDVIDLNAISPAALAIRVVATEPVAVFAKLRAEGGIAVTSASPVATNDWLLPGAGFGPAGAGRLVLVNVGVEIAEVTVTEVRDSSRSRVVTLQPDQVLELELDGDSSNGVSLTSDGLIVPLWVSEVGPGVAVSGGYPLRVDE